MGLQAIPAGHKQWGRALGETRYGGWCDDEAILDSLEVASQKFGPQVAIAERETTRHGGIVVDKLLKALKVQVHRAAQGMQEAATKAAAAEPKTVDKARQQAAGQEKQREAVAKKEAEAAKGAAAAQGGTAPSYPQDIESVKAKALADESAGKGAAIMADVGVVKGKDIKFLTKKWKLDHPVYLKGLGSAAATKGGELLVGDHTMTGVIVDQAM